MLNSRFSTAVCLSLGASLSVSVVLAETPELDAPHAAKVANTSISQESSTSPAVPNPTVPNSPSQISTQILTQPELADLPDLPEIPNLVSLPKIDVKPSLSTRIANRIFFWRTPKNKYTAPVEPKIIVEVKGAPEVLATNLKETLQQVTLIEFEDFQSDIPRLRSLAAGAAQAVGYYNAKFIFSKKSKSRLKVDVITGAPVKIVSQKIHITGEGEADPALIQLQQKPDLNVGDTFNHGTYEQTKAKIVSVARDRGYFNGQYIKHDVQVTLPTQTADIELSYATGERYVFGDVTYQNSNPNKKLRLKPSVLAALQPFKVGDPYDAASLAKLSRNLQDTRYFNNIQVDAPTPDPLPDMVSDFKEPMAQSDTADPLSDTTDGAQTKIDEQPQPVVIKADSQQIPTEKGGTKPSIPVVVVMNTDNPNSVETGLGFGTDTGPRLRTQYRRGLVNSSGHSFDVNTEWSKRNNSIDLRYNIPMSNPLSDVVSVFGGYAFQNISQTSGLQVDTKTTTLGIQRTINPFGEWQKTYSLRYRDDKLENSAININPTLLPKPFNVSGISSSQQALLIGFGLNKLTTKGGLNPTSGFRQFYQIEAGARSAYSDANMIILQAGLRALQTFAYNHQIVMSADLGKIFTLNFNQVPYNLRFFAGGDQSIRGYDYKSLSTDVNGFGIGGQNLIVGSLEYNYLLLPKLRGAVFVDAGNAFDNAFTTPVKVGAGIGIRYASPIGPIRVDLAAGVSENSPPIRLVFYIGAPL
jgi:translocation and assembly module TamA